ncbi:MAG TPA: class I SAM-dependent methyltransferase [Thermoanaerobaculia bacterium]|nr:class I SAM-dependent methyltransferase [Thermoanaerobaculia bacterium]
MSDDPTRGRGGGREAKLDDFLTEPTRDIESWRWLWRGDREFPIRSHRGLFGRLLVGWKRLVRPLVKVPQNDLWERQRVFNLILLDHLERAKAVESWHDARLLPLEGTLAEGLAEIMRHNDALFARVDQKLDGYRRDARDLLGSLGAALAALEGGAPSAETLGRAREEHGYFELERRYRGTEEEIAERIARYLPYLEGKAPVLDLGCGRGEALALLRERGVAARGVDSSERMVALCRERGLDAEAADLFDALAGVKEESLGAAVSFHVVEHLPPPVLDRLVRLAWRALRPGGVLILETPNPLSLVVAARNFWLDPTHVRPVHPEALELLLRQAGFAEVERLELRPFPDKDRLPEIDLSSLPRELHELADRVNRLRDRLDELLFGHQDYALIATKS